MLMDTNARSRWVRRHGYENHHIFMDSKTWIRKSPYFQGTDTWIRKSPYFHGFEDMDTKITIFSWIRRHGYENYHIFIDSKTWIRKSPYFHGYEKLHFFWIRKYGDG